MTTPIHLLSSNFRPIGRLWKVVFFWNVVSLTKSRPKADFSSHFFDVRSKAPKVAGESFCLSQRLCVKFCRKRFQRIRGLRQCAIQGAAKNIPPRNIRFLSNACRLLHQTLQTCLVRFYPPL